MPSFASDGSENNAGNSDQLEWDGPDFYSLSDSDLLSYLEGKALKSAALAGSEGYKWGGISGAISGGTSEAIALTIWQDESGPIYMISPATKPQKISDSFYDYLENI